MKVVALALSLALALPAVPAFAQHGPGGHAPQHPQHMKQRQPAPPPAKHHAQQPPRHQPQAQAPKHGHHAQAPRPPRIGESARRGQPFHQAQGSRFKPAPRGQEYRVMNDHLVLMDSRTAQIVGVVGLLSALLR